LADCALTDINGGLGAAVAGEEEVTWTAAAGFVGQRIFIVAKLDTIVVTRQGTTRQRPARYLYRFVFPPGRAK
jgi:hypothetical protein